MRFTKFRLSKLRCIEDPYIRNMFLKNAVMFLFLFREGLPFYIYFSLALYAPAARVAGEITTA